MAENATLSRRERCSLAAILLDLDIVRFAYRYAPVTLLSTGLQCKLETLGAAEYGTDTYGYGFGRIRTCTGVYGTDTDGSLILAHNR